MGRNSSGVKNSGNTRMGGGNSKGATEGGYTSKMVKNIVGIEQRYRNNMDETMHVFSASGDLLMSIGGKGRAVDYGGHTIPQNSIITHNHPGSIGQTGVRSIGNSFSTQDIYSVVSLNAKEIRAVTPTYTYSLKRPKGGWGVSASEARDTFAGASRIVKSEWSKNYVNKQNYSEAAIARIEATHFHKVMQLVSKELGWNYTKKKG